MDKLNQSDELSEMIGNIVSEKKKFPKDSFLIAISGIDASGKGYISKQIQEGLLKLNYTVHLENLDGWLELPEIRFSKIGAPLNFYQNAFRWDELKNLLLEPYKENKKIDFEMNYLEETWKEFQSKRVSISFVDIFLLEGIFLFRESMMGLYNYKIWIECPFETALKRALQRNQEGLKEEEIIQSYQTIFFPAQEIHIKTDSPKDKADFVYRNDSNLKNSPRKNYD